MEAAVDGSAALEISPGDARQARTSKPARCGRESIASASVSDTNRSAAGSHSSRRPSRQAIVPRWQVDTLRCWLSTSEIGRRRAAMQSKKFPM